MYPNGSICDVGWDGHQAVGCDDFYWTGGNIDVELLLAISIFFLAIINVS